MREFTGAFGHGVFEGMADRYFLLVSAAEQVAGKDDSEHDAAQGEPPGSPPRSEHAEVEHGGRFRPAGSRVAGLDFKPVGAGR